MSRTTLVRGLFYLSAVLNGFAALLIHLDQAGSLDTLALLLIGCLLLGVCALITERESTPYLSMWPLHAL